MKDRNHFKDIKYILFSWVLMGFAVCGLTDSVQVEAAKIKLSKTTANIKENAQITLQVKNTKSKVKWTTSKKSVVKIKAVKGKKKQTATLLGVNKGTAVVTAQVDKKKLKCKITVEHSWQEASCIMPKTCTSCGSISGTMLGHSFSTATCTDESRCTRCGVLGATALGHNYVDGFCSRCQDLNLGNIVSMQITTVPSTQIVNIYISNQGLSSHQVRTDTGSYGTAVLHLSNGTNQTVWLWDNDDCYYYSTMTYYSGDNGKVAFSNEDATWSTDPGTTIEFDFFYNHVKCHAIVGTNASATKIVRVN
ncbi:MAG: hypothetical protein K2K09_02510 [Lachnospiraceae bacterium]|nr:hypothetical protein [Lachnospiraceae bacterium]